MKYLDIVLITAAILICIGAACTTALNHLRLIATALALLFITLLTSCTTAERKAYLDSVKSREGFLSGDSKSVRAGYRVEYR